MAGTRDILSSKRGLAEHDNYHELCRLLGRLKTNYQLSELVRGGGVLGGVAWRVLGVLASWSVRRCAIPGLMS